MGSLSFLDMDFSMRKGDDEASLYPDAVDTSAMGMMKIPQVDRPAAYLRDAFANANPRDRIKYAHGTTTMAFKFKGGIIVAVDSRASMGQCTFELLFLAVRQASRLLPCGLHTF